MAQHGTLKEGDVVTHPDWPVGTTRVVGAFYSLGTRGGYDAHGRYRVTKLHNERYLLLDASVDTGDGEPDDYWAEAGLEKVK